MNIDCLTGPPRSRLAASCSLTLDLEIVFSPPNYGKSRYLLCPLPIIKVRPSLHEIIAEISKTTTTVHYVLT